MLSACIQTIQYRHSKIVPPNSILARSSRIKAFLNFVRYFLFCQVSLPAVITEPRNQIEAKMRVAEVGNIHWKKGKKISKIWTEISILSRLLLRSKSLSSPRNSIFCICSRIRCYFLCIHWTFFLYFTKFSSTEQDQFSHVWKNKNVAEKIFYLHLCTG